jgi:hypothetical protein
LAHDSLGSRASPDALHSAAPMRVVGPLLGAAAPLTPLARLCQRRCRRYHLHANVLPPSAWASGRLPPSPLFHLPSRCCVVF